MGEYDAKTKLGALGDHFQAFNRLAKILMTAHGIGFAGCLAVLKERSPQLNVGIFLWLFGSGLLLAGLYFFMLIIAEVEVRQAILSQAAGAGVRGRVIQVLTHVGCGVRWLPL